MAATAAMYKTIEPTDFLHPTSSSLSAIYSSLTQVLVTGPIFVLFTPKHTHTLSSHRTLNLLEANMQLSSLLLSSLLLVGEGFARPSPSRHDNSLVSLRSPGDYHHTN